MHLCSLQAAVMHSNLITVTTIHLSFKVNNMMRMDIALNGGLMHQQLNSIVVLNALLTSTTTTNYKASR